MGTIEIGLDGKSYLLIFLLIFFLFLNSGTLAKDSVISFAPKEPRPGDDIMIRYDPEGTDLNKASELDLVAYLFSNELPEANTFPLKKLGREWITTVPTKKNTLLVALKVIAGQAIDSDKRRGYLIKLYDQEGKILPGCRASMADALSYWYELLGMEANPKRALTLFEEEFKDHPELKKDFLPPYMNLLYGLAGDPKKLRLLKELDDMEARPSPSIKELDTLHTWYTILERTDDAERIGRILKKRDPKGRFAQYDRYQQLASIQGIDEKIGFLAEYKKDFPDSLTTPFVQGKILEQLEASKEYSQAKRLLEENPDTASSFEYVTLAEEMLKSDADLASAEGIIAKGVDLARRIDGNRRPRKPSYMTEKEWKKNRDEKLGAALKIFGKVLLRRGQGERALRALGEASALIGNGDAELNELYAEALLDRGKFEDALSRIGSFIAAGTGTLRMKEQFKRAYLRSRGSDLGLTERLEKLEEAGAARIMAEVKEKMTDQPAPGFSLKGLDGRIVSLSSLKGKIVVLDFWATWCGPCQESFPGMKLLVEKYAGDLEVGFLFIDTFETAQDREKAVSDFLGKNGYSFHVLLDQDDSVAQAYKIEGVPTKIIIDGAGRIRYRSIGYEGNTSRLFDEVRSAIELLRSTRPKR